MADGKNAEDLGAQAAEAVRRVVSEAESRAAEVLREAEAKAATIREQAEAEASQIRERAEKDARDQIEAAKRALDELGGTLAAAASAAAPRSEEGASEPEPEPEPELEPEETPGAPETLISPPASEPEAPEPEQAVARTENGDDAAERLVAMKLAVDGKDPAAIEAELIEKFGPGDRTELLKEVLSRLPR
jgi:hypothetical protein